MVGTKKRKSLHKPTTTRYPLDFHFSSLTYKQAPQTLSISKQSFLVSAPSNQFNIIAGDLFNVNSPILKNSVKLVENYHNQHTITHLKWNQKGNAIASVDETGRLAVWQIQDSIHIWSLVYKIDLKQPLASLLWLNSDCLYSFQDDDSLKRDSFIGPRNPYGQLSFITVTVHGEITVYYQRNGSIFSSFLTHMPNIGRREISRVDAGCFAMSLAGLEDWKRISHAEFTLDSDGTIYLASHNASLQYKTITLHTINIKFPRKSTENGAIECSLLTTLKLERKDDLLAENNVTQLTFKKNSARIELIIGLGEKVNDNRFQTMIATWKLTDIQKNISSNFGDISISKKEFVHQSSILIKDQFITSLTCTSTGQILASLSDGSIHMELASQEGLFKTSCMKGGSIDSHFWKIADSLQTDDSCVDFVTDITLSPNETHAIYSYSSGRIGISRISTSSINDTYIKTVYQKLQLCLFNNMDYLDLVSEIAMMNQQEEYQAQSYAIINNVLDAYEIYFNEDGHTLQSNQPLSNWNLPSLEKCYGVALAFYKRLPKKQVQYDNLCRAIQLPILLECFIGSCTTYYSDVMDILEKKTIDENATIEFNSNSLWSLVSLCNWTWDYLRWILREWNMLLHIKKPNNAQNNDMSEKAVHAVLLLHKDSRDCLSKLLKMTYYFIQYATTSNYYLDHLPESQPLLHRYTTTLSEFNIINIKETISFLNELEELKTNTKNIENRWSLLLSSNLKQYTIADIQKISERYKDKCAKPSIYIDRDIDYKYDVIRKRHLIPGVKTNQCIRCHQYEITVDPSKEALDPCYYAQWYQSIGKHCVCGGVFF